MELIQSGSSEAVAFALLQVILQHNPGLTGKEEILKLYQDCAAAVRGPQAEDLLAALGMED